ncbi:MAG TPA: Hpt domain-containing protein, partial [Caulobacteraceae bacterium]|nr:Hpt domain-containing protein [Caulobacteraceae bacterium]
TGMTETNAPRPGPWDPRPEDGAPTPAVPEPARAAEPPLDTSALAALFDGDEEFLRQLLQEFLASNLASRERLLKGLEAQAWEEVRQAAHKLAGSSRTVGAAALAAAGDAVEVAVIEGRTEGIETLVARASAELDHVAAFIEGM